MEVYCLTAQKDSVLHTIAKWVSAVLSLAALTLIPGIPGMVGFVALAGLAAYLFWTGNVEYECSYFDGEFRFTKIYNKNRRSRTKTISGEALAVIAPAGDRGVAGYEKNNTVKVMDHTSKNPEIPYYEMVISDAGVTYLYKLELEEKFLQEVSRKYPMKVVRKRNY